jgi:hypothetical protein
MNAPAPFARPQSALVVVSGGDAPPDAAHKASVSAVNARLLKALPAAHSVLELCSGQASLATAYQQAHPGAHWVTLDAAEEEAMATLASEEPVELIVVRDLAGLPHPERLLPELGQLLRAGGALVLAAENHACFSQLARLIEADLSTGMAANPAHAHSLAAAHPRQQSPSSVFKMLMDAGWMPHLLDHEPDEPANDKVGAAVRYIADAQDVGPGCVDRVHRMRHLIIEARRTFQAEGEQTECALFDVVVPSNREAQLRLNVEQSPGLQDVQARVISCRHAPNPAQALAECLPHVRRDWVLLCHQDVYFPSGFGAQLNAVLASIPDEQKANTLLGFIGMGINRQTQACEPRGFVIDRLHRVDHPASDAAVSLDELAIVVARDSVHQIDPHIGWHLWATELCLTAICTHQVLPRIVRLPLFHNSHTGWHTTSGFLDAADYLHHKHASFGPVHTLCGVIEPGFIAQQRSRLS